MRDADREIAHALQIVIDFDGGGHQTQISRERSLQGEKADGHVINFDFELVDAGFIFDNLLGQLLIFIDNALYAAINGAFNQRAHFKELALELFEFLFIMSQIKLRSILLNIGCQPNRPVT